MHSSKPDWVFGEARLISSTSTTFANTGPGRNSNLASRWLKTLVPTTSAGSRSAVHCTRAYSASIERASARARAVLPTPGLSSISTCPSATTDTSRSLSVSSGTFTALATFPATRWPSAATASGSNSGTLAMAVDDLTGGGWPAVQIACAERLSAHARDLRLAVGRGAVGGGVGGARAQAHALRHRAAQAQLERA